MNTSERVLAIIPARGGSKGLPGKNIRPLQGKPLLAWTVEAARACPLLDRVILSSDDETIMATAREWGCEVPFIRPPHLADDKASMMDVIWHAWQALGKRHAWLVLLQPTSPLRWAADITACLEICLRGSAPAAVSMTATSKPPHWLVTLDEAGHPYPLLPGDGLQRQRQELLTTYLPNGAVYVANTYWLAQTQTFITRETKVHIMPAERSVDIDSELDFRLCQLLLERGQHEHL
ncbi:MAG: acylneuraminate cytidylyltransferase family protein [Magnetococcales bacterium]|nr:acylneuraminate cytidylyltransferase family protein [Magnetococcales bacterium]NGZ28397.1 acylneuraminate cytidylyltransferase family protein [Magnetococcales bacterium]